MIAAAYKKKPFLRFKDDNGQEYPDWEVKKFEDVYRFISTNSYSRDNLNYKNGLVKNIHYGDILTKFKTQFNVDQEEVPFINNEISLGKYAPDNYCISGDLIISDASEDYEGIGKLIEINRYNSEKILAGLHTIHARQKSQDIEVGFAGHLLNSWNSRYQIMRIAQGTKVFGISSKRLGKISITIPSSEEEQKKIADFLSFVDQKVQLLEKKKEQLELYKKGLMQQLFTQQIRFKDDNGEEYPDWEEKKLGEICSIKGGGTPDTSKPHYWGGKINWFTPSELNSKYLSKSKRTVTLQGVENSSAKILPVGTILLSTRATIGEVSLVAEECTTNQGFQSLIVNNNNLNEYIYYWILNNKRVLLKYASGSTFLEIGKKEIVKLKINLPSLPEQKKIADFLSSVDKKIEITNTQIDKTKAFKKGLLQQMFV